MRAPRFWDGPPGVMSSLLMPAGAAWTAGARLRRGFARPYHAPVPVICVGNVVAGGAGKTPVALAVAGFLAGCGIAVHLISRGYGGRLARSPAPVRVDSRHHDAAAVGDEPLLLASRAPCWIAADRAAAARAATAAGAGALVLDDGFQNPGLAKDLSLLVVDAAYGLGNGRVMPAGPLREPAAAALARTDALVVLGGSVPAWASPAELPVLQAELAPVEPARFAGQNVFAFAGIGRPEKFFATLAGAGARLAGTRVFPDHHPFTEGELAELRAIAAQAEARLVTTAKDFVRLPAALRSGIAVLDIEVRWREPAALAALLAPAVAAMGGHGRKRVAHRG